MLNGTLVKDEWYLLKKIGEGAFGEIYSTRNVNTNKVAAIKLERVDSKKQVLKLEVAALKRLQSCPHVTRLLTCGKFRGRESEWNYMIMDLFGENMSELRKRQGGRFDIATTLRIGVRFLSLIEEVHLSGYVHRDVKPSNFVVGLSGEKRRNIYMIDFGLARRFMSVEGELRLERECAGFRGTTRYASINSHMGKDLSRRDDLWSIFYILVEFAKGSLPWRRFKDKDKVGEMKMACTSPDFVKGLPPEFNSFLDHLQSLQFQDQPIYSYLKDLLHQALRGVGGNDNSPFPWENAPPPTWLLASIPTRISLTETTEISTRTPSRDYSRGGTADLMATTSDSHEKSSEFRFISRDADVVTPLPTSPRILTSSSNTSLPDIKHQSRKNMDLDVGDTNVNSGGFVELDLSEKTKNLDLQSRGLGRRRVGQKPKKHSSKSVSLSKKKKKQVDMSENPNGVSKCSCNLL